MNNIIFQILYPFTCLCFLYWRFAFIENCFLSRLVSCKLHWGSTFMNKQTEILSSRPGENDTWKTQWTQWLIYFIILFSIQIFLKSTMNMPEYDLQENQIPCSHEWFVNLALMSLVLQQNELNRGLLVFLIPAFSPFIMLSALNSCNSRKKTKP